MKKTRIVGTVLAACVLALVTVAHLAAQQNQANPNQTQAQLGPSTLYVIPIAATAAVNAQTTLTLPAPPPGLYNYVCNLHFNASNDGTGTAAVNNVTTSTNFNSYALKFSLALAADTNYDWVENWGAPATGGCAKSTSPGTATTFVSPAALTHTAFTWTGTYYQAQ